MLGLVSLSSGLHIRDFEAGEVRALLSLFSITKFYYTSG